jgi:hypothetical protein
MVMPIPTVGICDKVCVGALPGYMQSLYFPPNTHVVKIWGSREGAGDRRSGQAKEAFQVQISREAPREMVFF